MFDQKFAQPVTYVPLLQGFLNGVFHFCSLKIDQVTVLYCVQCALLNIENDAEIFPAHYTWKVAEKRFKMALIMNKLAMINSCEMNLEK